VADETLLKRQGMDGRIHKVREKAEAIWKKPLLRQYTDHTVAHSLRVIFILDKLCPLLKVSLTDDEVYVLLCAAFLHDIGMQQEKFFEMKVLQEHYSKEEIEAAQSDPMQGEAIIRQWHHLVGEERIKYELGDKYIEADFVDEVAQVSKGHTKENLSTYKDGTKAGSPMRLRLLAALLRLADELDLDYRRVDLAELNQAIIPEESRAHWWKCHYVESVDVNGEGRIQVVFRFSENDGQEAVQIVPVLVIDKLRQTLYGEGLMDILWPHLHIRLDEIPEVGQPAVSKQAVPENVLDIFRREASKVVVERAKQSIQPVAAFASGKLSIAFGDTPEGISQEAIEQWQAGQRQDAIATFQAGVSRFPGSPGLNALLADVYNYVGEWESAVKAAQRALASDPNHFVGLLDLGIALSHLDQFEQALEHLQTAELVSYSRGPQPRAQTRLYVAIARSLAGLGDHWYARQRLQAASGLLGAAHTPEDKEIATEMTALTASVEEKLGALELVEGYWEFQDLVLQPILGQWATQPPCVFAAPTISGEGILLGGSSSWFDYTFECEFQLLHQAAGFFIRADVRAMTGLMMQLTPVKLRRHQKEFSDYHRHEIIEVGLPVPLARNEWHIARFEAAGSVLRTHVNNQLIDEWTDLPSGFASGKVGFRLFLGEVALYRLPRILVTRKAVHKA
jgi:tetratricopeptide (TPR) repeat protein